MGTGSSASDKSLFFHFSAFSYTSQEDKNTPWGAVPPEEYEQKMSQTGIAPAEVIDVNS